MPTIIHNTIIIITTRSNQFLHTPLPDKVNIMYAITVYLIIIRVIHGSGLILIPNLAKSVND